MTCLKNLLRGTRLDSKCWKIESFSAHALYSGNVDVLAVHRRIDHVIGP